MRAAPERDVTEYPFVFFPVGLNVRGRTCVVIGPSDDREAIEKAAALEEVGARVVRIADPARMRDADVAGAFFVISTPHDAALSARLRALADEHRFLLCAIDQPNYGFVAMQAIAKAGPIRIAISTGGIAPRIGGILKAALQRTLDPTFVRFIDCLNAQRERNRTRLTEPEDRRASMLRATEGFEVEITVRYPDWFEAERAAVRPSFDGVYPERSRGAPFERSAQDDTEC